MKASFALWPFLIFCNHFCNAEVKLHSLEYHDDIKVHKLHLSHEDGREYHLELRKPESDHVVLHPSLTVAQAYTDSNGKLHVENWTPDDDTFNAATSNIYVDQTNKATIRIESMEKGKHLISGILKEFTIHNDGSSHFARNRTNDDQYTDYLRVPPGALNSSSSSHTPSVRGEDTEYIVELLIFAEKELADQFGQDRRKALDYYTVVLYDNNLQYRSLKNLKVTYRLSGLVLNVDAGSQPYVEKTRNEKGQADLGGILTEFGKWLYENKGKFNKFDMATVAIKTSTTWGGGLAWLGSVCGADDRGRQHYNVFVFSDSGNFAQFSAHESAHVLGSPHDDDEDTKEECNNVKGYIMSGGNSEFQYFFSDCSEKFIRTTIEKPEKDCLRQIDNKSPAQVDFNSPLAPSMNEICKRQAHPDAYVAEEDKGNCRLVKCRWESDGATYFEDERFLVDNLECTASGNTKGRCFRGRCRKPGYLIKNVRSGLCLKTTDSFSHWSAYQLVWCPTTPTALDKFVMDVGSTGVTLATPFSQVVDGKMENDDKCLWAGRGDDDRSWVWSDRCRDYTDPDRGFDLVNVGNSQFLLKHKPTGRCLKPEDATRPGAWIYAYKNCDRNNKDMRWTRSL